ncbi:MAG: sugar ABC transporter permease [Candidatus Cohnella colombiensis]|uniref:Sugar ABC transporter permease n=1 Tax=Candidatus Cohnella colombiensis TaxID=3121368 RepID=A0AA95F234_9BACL|nr:MAG: sugar ABC transporter permease [Cohnella sp.]
MFTSPAVLGFILFAAGPMLASLVMSFTNYSVIGDVKFIGFDNYTRLFTGEAPFYFKSIMVTVYLVVLNVPLGIIGAFLVALLLNNKVRGWSILRLVYYIPTIVPIVASAMIWMWMMNPDFGLLNYLLEELHLPTSKWLFGEDSVIPSLVMMAVWSTGNIMVVFLAGLQGVPHHLFEAIEIDGGGTFRKLIHVTLPLMTPIIFFNAVMHMIASMQTFLQAYIITDGGPNNSSLFYVYYLYREAFTFQNIGGSTAMAWVLFVGIATMTGLAFLTSKKWVFYEGDD